MTRWEYKEEKNCAIEKLDELGKEGWELVAVVNDRKVKVSEIQTATLAATVFFFKRPMTPTS